MHCLKVHCTLHGLRKLILGVVRSVTSREFITGIVLMFRKIIFDGVLFGLQISFWLLHKQPCTLWDFFIVVSVVEREIAVQRRPEVTVSLAVGGGERQMDGMICLMFSTLLM